MGQGFRDPNPTLRGSHSLELSCKRVRETMVTVITGPTSGGLNHPVVCVNSCDVVGNKAHILCDIYM